MKKFLREFYRSKNNIYKLSLLFLSSAIILYLFPRGVAFKYDFQKGKPWMYESLYAPFNFPIYKSSEELEQERQQIKENTTPYYNYDAEVVNEIKSAYQNNFDSYFEELSKKRYETLYNAGIHYIDSIYHHGVVLSNKQINSEKVNILKSDQQLESVDAKYIFRLDELAISTQNYFPKQYSEKIYKFLFEILSQNIFINEDITQKEVQEGLSKIALTRGTIDTGKRIIVKGEIVDNESYKILNSLKEELQSQAGNAQQKWLELGYAIFILLILTLMTLFIKKYYPEVFIDNGKMTFIFVNIVLIVSISHFAINLNTLYVYAIPMCILPLILSVFLETRISFIVQIVTILILGFIVPNSFEFIFMQATASLVILVSSTQIHKRVSLFITVGKVISVYILTYIAFNVIRGDLNIASLLLSSFHLFLINGLLILLVQPLTYIYEKSFLMVSNLSLLELSDTNSKLLNLLSEKAPGTFYHSLQVANLSETAANEIGANTLLVRVGALYHDIGKMKNPAYFIENQVYITNLHDDLTPLESAKIIISHVIDGIELAKKYNLPDRVIDFIRTHHGTSLVRFFYSKEKERNPDADSKLFKYPGPIPFSKESAIVMMADIVEASSRSLKQPTQEAIDTLVEKVINMQINEDQFLNADITLKQIESIKKIFKKKLANIYKLRIEYPE